MYPTRLDLMIRGAVHNTQSDSLTSIAYALSFLGSAPVLAVLFVIAIGVLLRAKRRVAIQTLLIVMAGEIVLQNGLKVLIARPRPEPFFPVTVDTYSFPSGHALSALCFFGTLALLARGFLQSPGWRTAVLAASATLIMGIGWSRIYLGVHYPSDVIGGFVIGVAWIGFLAAINWFRIDQRTFAAVVPADNPPAGMGPLRPVLVVMGRKPGALRDRPAMQDRLLPLMRAAWLEPEFVNLEAVDLSERIKRASTSGVCAIVAAGGDGTISSVGQHLAGTSLPLGVIPLGTMNLFANDVGIPTDDLAAAVAVLGALHTRRIDAGEVNGHYFFCGSALGLPARLAQYRRRGDTWFESIWLWLRYARAFLRSLLRYRPLRVTLVPDGRPIDKPTMRISASSLIITPNPVNDLQGPMFGRSSLDGGTLAVYVIGRLRLHDVLRLAMRVVISRWQSDALVTAHMVRRLAVASASPGVRVMNDGEIVILKPPLRYRIVPRALVVICPQPVPAESVS